MVVIKTVKCKLQANDEQRSLLLSTLQKFNDACNDILKIAQQLGVRNKFKLQRLCYHDIKKKTQFKSKSRCSCYCTCCINA